MTTAVEAAVPRTTSEDRFFLTMALAMATVIVAGFAFNLAMGRSTFSVPPIYHVHAFFFFGWTVIYTLQNVFVATGATHLHRRLGWIAMGWVPAMVVLGTAITVVSVRTHGGPPFFDEREFLFGAPFGIFCFAALVAFAIGMRKRTDWHRRLMLCAMALLTGPGFGRLLPTPLLIPWAWWITDFVFPAIFPVIGMFADWRRTGRVHPAWSVGLGAGFAALFLADVIAFSAWGTAITHAVVAGTPGAERIVTAHFP